MKSLLVGEYWVPGDSVLAIRFDEEQKVAEVMFKPGLSPFGEMKVYAAGEDYDRLKGYLAIVVNGDHPAIKKPQIIGDKLPPAEPLSLRPVGDSLAISGTQRRYLTGTLK